MISGVGIFSRLPGGKASGLCNKNKALPNAAYSPAKQRLLSHGNPELLHRAAEGVALADEKAADVLGVARLDAL